MAKKNKYVNFILVGVVIVALFLLYAVKNDVFTTKAAGSDSGNVEGITLALSVSPNHICVDTEKAIFTVGSNLAEKTLCSSWYNIGEGWKFIDNFNLNSNGDYVISTEINIPGNTVFRVACENETMTKLSNEVSLAVNKCGQQQEPVELKCVDADGGQDDQHLIYGTCTGASGTGTWDGCSGGLSGGNLIEAYCDMDKECHTSVWVCTDGQICSMGKCTAPECEDIVNPQSQQDCDIGNTPKGSICGYWQGFDTCKISYIN